MRHRQLPHTHTCCNSLNNFRAANPMPIHSPNLTNHKPGFEPLKDELFNLTSILSLTPGTSLPRPLSTYQHPFRLLALHQGLLLPQETLTPMIWDGGLLREPYAQRRFFL
ncbi:hypothetical protein TNCV_245861 [Trichonephila clavipes]|nr:hypothetical protein TNCV_245861 [Trichonephila clavipes]